MIARMSSGSSRADIAVEPTRSQNITVSWRRSAASGAGSCADEVAITESDAAESSEIAESSLRR